MDQKMKQMKMYQCRFEELSLGRNVRLVFVHVPDESHGLVAAGSKCLGSTLSVFTSCRCLVSRSCQIEIELHYQTQVY